MSNIDQYLLDEAFESLWNKKVEENRWNELPPETLKDLKAIALSFFLHGSLYVLKDVTLKVKDQLPNGSKDK